jgi:LysR family transcriptional regulator AphB
LYGSTGGEEWSILASFAGARAPTSGDLKNHRPLGFSKRFDDVSWKLSDGQVTERVPLKPWLGINDYAGVIRAAIAGMGIAEIPSILCGRELHQGLLVTVIPQWRFEEVDLSAFYLTRRHPSRVSRSLL